MPQRIQRPQTTQRRFYGSLPSTSVIPSSDDSDASPLLRGFRSRPSITLQLPLIRTGRRNLDNAPGLGLEGTSGEPLPQMDEVSRATLGRKPSASSVRSEKRVAVGRSTFGQTVYFILFHNDVYVYNSLVISALQFHCDSPWIWDAVRATGLFIRGLGRRDDAHHLIRLDHMLLVRILCLSHLRALFNFDISQCQNSCAYHA